MRDGVLSIIHSHAGAVRVLALETSSIQREVAM